MRNYLLSALGILALIGIGFLIIKGVPVAKTTKPQETSDLRVLNTKTDDQAGVLVEITPINTLSNSGELKFNVVMNTHTFEITKEMVLQSTLEDSSEKTYKAKDWQGTESGHHMNGVLVFPMPKKVDSFSLEINGIGGESIKRVFNWKI